MFLYAKKKKIRLTIKKVEAQRKLLGLSYPLSIKKIAKKENFD